LRRGTIAALREEVNAKADATGESFAFELYAAVADEANGWGLRSRERLNGALR
jgi:hypothetical protein